MPPSVRAADSSHRCGSFSALGRIGPSAVGRGEKMSKVSVFAKFSCQEGKGEEMDAALRAIVAASESVDGVESYSYHRGDDGTYWFFALMSSMEAAQQHGNNEAMQAVMPALMSLMAGPPDMAMTTPVAANGFDF